MKCTQCGNNELKKTNPPYEIYGDAYFKSVADTYICLNCGHYEIFDTKKIEEFKSTCEEIEKFERMIFELDKIIADLDKEKEKLNQELRQLEEESKNKDITMRQHEQILLKIKEKKDINKLIAHICAEKMKNANIFDQHTLNIYGYNAQGAKKNLEEKLQGLLEKKERI